MFALVKQPQSVPVFPEEYNEWEHFVPLYNLHPHFSPPLLFFLAIWTQTHFSALVRLFSSRHKTSHLSLLCVIGSLGMLVRGSWLPSSF